MPKKPHLKTLMDRQHVKRSETLLKSSPQIFVTFSDFSERKSAQKILF